MDTVRAAREKREEGVEDGCGLGVRASVLIFSGEEYLVSTEDRSPGLDRDRKLGNKMSEHGD